eukprot:9481555-Pyramimonas_sp.AAC.1
MVGSPRSARISDSTPTSTVSSSPLGPPLALEASLSWSPGTRTALWPRSTPFDFVPLAAGRVATLLISNPARNQHLKLMNIHNFDLSLSERAHIRTAWDSSARWAQQAERHRLFVAIGDFNVSDHEPVQHLRPQPARARVRRSRDPPGRPDGAAPGSFDADAHSGSEGSGGAPPEHSEDGLPPRAPPEVGSVWRRAQAGQSFWRRLFQGPMLE